MPGAKKIRSLLALRPVAAAVLSADATSPDFELLCYGDIGESWFGDSVSARDVVQQLQQADASHVLVRVNSYGGSVSDGIAIYNALRAMAAQGVQISVRVEGVAASIASLIAMAGDTREMYPNTLLMIHAPWTVAAGNSAQMREMADVLDTYASAMSTSYARATGSDVADELLQLTDGADHWFTAEEALADGYATAVLDQVDAQTDTEAKAMPRNAPVFAAITRYRNAPHAIAASMQRGQSIARFVPVAVSQPEPIRQPAASAAKPQESFMNFKALAQNLGLNLPENATDAQAKALVLAHLKLSETATDADVGSALATNAAQAELRAANARTGEQARRTEIASAFAGFRARGNAYAELERQCLDDMSISTQTARDRLLAKLGEGAEPLGGGLPDVRGGADSRDKFIDGVGQALMARAGAVKREAGNEYNGLSLSRIAEACLVRNGITVRGLSSDAIARKVLAANSTSDFPLLLSNVAGKMLRAAYESFPDTFQLWCAVGEVSDFKAHPRIQLGSFNNLATIPEGSEYTYGSLGEESESITAVTKGKALMLTRQMIVNDDLGGFNRRAQMMGRAAARTVNTDVYALLTSGAGNNGPTMSDTGQLFNSTAITTVGGHANLAGTGTVPSITSIAAGRAAMRKQKDLNKRDTLNIMPRYILAPVGLEDTVWSVLNSTADPTSSNSNKKNFINEVANLTLITDPYLDGISATAWHMVADPLDVPLIEVAFLDGQQAPFIDEAIDFETDAVKFKVRLDYGLSAIDWRAGYKNPGAAPA